MTLTPAICLALIVYHEARGEPHKGQLAVAEVAVERVMDPRWPDDVCEVMLEPRQFSFVGKGGKWPEPDKDSPEWKKALTIGSDYASGISRKRDTRLTKGANHYLHKRLTRVWTKGMVHTVTIGNHKFYKQEKD